MIERYLSRERFIFHKQKERDRERERERERVAFHHMFDMKLREGSKENINNTGEGLFESSRATASVVSAIAKKMCLC